MVEVVVVGRKPEPGRPVGGVELQFHVAGVLAGDPERVDALLAQDLPALAVQAVAAAREVVQAVVRRQPAGGAQVVEQVSHAALPVQPREVGVAKHLDAAPDVAGFRRPRGVVQAVGVVVPEQPPAVPAIRVGPPSGDLSPGERDQLHVRQAHGAARHAPRRVAGGDPPVLLADHQVLAAQVGNLPEQLPDPVPSGAVGHRAGEHGGAGIPAQAGQHHHVLRGLGHQPQRHRVVAGRTQRIGELGSVRLLVGPQHRAGQPLQLVRQQPPVAGARTRVQHRRRPAGVQVGAIDRRLREPAVADQISARISHERIVKAAARLTHGPGACYDDEAQRIEQGPGRPEPVGPSRGEVSAIRP